MVLQIGGPPPPLPLPEDPGAAVPGIPGAAPLPPEALDALAQELPPEGPQDIEVPAPNVGAEEDLALDPNKVDPIIATYKHPEMGPFLCANCKFFQEDNSCKIVSGFIDEAGVCSNFTPPDEGAEDPEALIAEAQELQELPELPPEALEEGLPIDGLPVGPIGPAGPAPGLPEGGLPPGVV